MGEVTRIADALKTIESICRHYSVRNYIDVDIGRIAVYNAANDNFHFFKWAGRRYIYDGSADTIPGWLNKRIAI